MSALTVSRVRPDTVVLQKKTNITYHPMTLNEFRCFKHNITIRKKGENFSLSIRNDGRNINGEKVQLVDTKLSKDEVLTLIDELQKMITYKGEI